jgi:hypothetical protein
MYYWKWEKGVNDSSKKIKIKKIKAAFYNMLIISSHTSISGISV